MKKIAIIGTGISGIGAALCLDRHHDIHCFESEPRIGGHTRTIQVSDHEKMLNVDTGFIVFNQKNYPHLTAMLDYLAIKTYKSNMSFGVSAQGGAVEYGTDHIRHLLWHPSLKTHGPYWKMIIDIIRFNHHGKAFLRQGKQDKSLRDFIQQHRFGPWFRDYFLRPMAGSIWSTPLQQIDEFSTQHLLDFFNNHGLLSLFNQPQWYSIQGGSQQYLQAFEQHFQGTIHTKKKIIGVQSTNNQLKLTDASGSEHHFDHVIFACHSDQSAACLKKHFPKKAQLLEKIPYQENQVICHSDIRFMPKDRRAWASWVYLQDHSHSKAISLTYWMNHLQDLPQNPPIFVTLNPQTSPDPQLIYDTCTLSHPKMSQSTKEHQSNIESIQGEDGIDFAGAWLGHGFHEDGLASGIRAAHRLGGIAPWGHH